MQRLIPPILFLLCLGLMVLLRRLWPIAVIVPGRWRWVGLVPIVVGVASGAMGIREFVKAKTNLRPFREADKLLTTGPFRYTRNPMYLGLALALLGACVLLGVLSPVLGVVIFVVVADRWYIRFEERMLRKKFGPDFDEYCARVRRWV
jgi:protein-S-isoprenylcysteine O-methyltransferase Ste14